jgi:hypothetical protein
MGRTALAAICLGRGHRLAFAHRSGMPPAARRRADNRQIARSISLGRQATASGMIAGGIIWIEHNVFGQAAIGLIVLALSGVADAAKIVEAGGIWIELDCFGQVSGAWFRA